MEEELLLGTAGAGSREEAAPVTEGGRAGLWKEGDADKPGKKRAPQARGGGGARTLTAARAGPDWTPPGARRQRTQQRGGRAEGPAA